MSERNKRLGEVSGHAGCQSLPPGARHIHHQRIGLTVTACVPLAKNASTVTKCLFSVTNWDRDKILSIDRDGTGLGSILTPLQNQRASSIHSGEGSPDCPQLTPIASGL